MKTYLYSHIYIVWILALILAGFLIGFAVNAQTEVTGEYILPDSSSTSEIIPNGTSTETAAITVLEPTFEERIAQIQDADVIKLVEIKEETDSLASKYAQLYDSCRFSR